MELWTIYLFGALLLVLSYQQWRLYRYRADLERREELFRVVAENAADMIALVDVKGRRLYNSPAYQKVLGYSPDELSKTSAFEQIHPEDRFRVLEASREARRTGVGQTVEYRIRHKDGRWLILESTASTIRNRTGDVTHLVIVNRDITARKRAERQLEEHLFHDVLTGLPNRRLFLDRLDHAFARARRDPAFRYAVLLVDLDAFKTLNSNHGASSGDEVLLEAGRRILSSLRADDTVARTDVTSPADSVLSRLGGDEFAILLEGTSDPSDAMRVARRILAALAPPISLGSEASVTASIGIALNLSGAERPDHLLQDAETAMRRARALGGNRAELFDETMHSRAEGRLRLESALRLALEQQQFHLLYQPIVHLGSRDIAQLEALLRWQHPEHGLVSPDDFLEVAEDTGLILAIGNWTLREACRQSRAWQSSNPHLPAVPITINCSARQFLDPRLIGDIRSALQDFTLSPALLQIEVPESVAVSNLAVASDVFAQLKRLGVRISLGDFGSGFCSLTWLRRWPIDEIKIDRALVRTLATDRYSRDVAQMILQLARTLNLQAVAEGIETDLQSERLLKLGCEVGQGYLFSRPLDAARIEQFLLRRQAHLTRPTSAGT
jgi:diguanylate cyclase (GGDEF)-like protein/PAS domain S-box-containing protein